MLKEVKMGNMDVRKTESVIIGIVLLFAIIGIVIQMSSADLVGNAFRRPSPKLNVFPSEAYSGDEVLITGEFFPKLNRWTVKPPYPSFTLTIDGEEFYNFERPVNGDFKESVIIPEMDPGKYTIGVKEVSGVSANIEIDGEEGFEIEWEKVYGEDKSDEGYSVTKTCDGGYILTGSSYFEGEDNNLIIIKINGDGVEEWVKVIDNGGSDTGRKIIETEDCNYIICGETTIKGKSQQFLLINIDEGGDLIWEKTYGGDYTDVAKDVIQTSDGGFLMAGYTFSYGDPSGDAWLIKTDAKGNMLWNNTYGGAHYSVASSVSEIKDNSYVFSGFKKEGGYNFWLVKVDEEGDLIWEETYDKSSSDIVNSMIPTKDGGFLMAGRTYTKEEEDYFSDNFWLVKVDEEGDLIWEETYDKKDDIANSVIQTVDEDYIVTGFTMEYGGPGDSDFWIIKIDADGDLIWEETYDYNEGNEVPNQIIEANEGEYIIVGRTDGDSYPWSDIILVKFEEK